MAQHEHILDGFSSERLRAVADMEKGHFWFVARRELVSWLVSETARRAATSKLRRIVDLGCGPGHALGEWARYADEVVGVDMHEPPVLSEHGSVRQLKSDAASTGLEQGCADLVLALDLIEHTDDAAVLTECARLLRPGGRLIVSVPAYKWLWGPRDQGAGHLRRYSKAMLRGRLQAAGFTVETGFGYQFFLLPLVVLSRLLAFRNKTQMRDFEDRPPAVINALLSGVNRAEVAMTRRGIRFPAGSSLFMVASR